MPSWTTWRSNFNPKRSMAMNEGNTALAGANLGPFNPEDQMSVRSFFEKIADTVCDASELSKEVARLRTELEHLAQEVQIVREQNWRMDQEIVELRSQRDSARADNENLRGLLNKQSSELQRFQEANTRMADEADRHNEDHQQMAQTLRTVRDERDEAQVTVMELEEKLQAVIREAGDWKDKAQGCQAKLDTLKSIFTE